MRSFHFNAHHRAESVSSEGGVLDSLIDAAGGAPLPGRWGLAQALITIWSEEPKGWAPVFYTKQTLNSLGAIRAYRQETDPNKRRRKDPLREYKDDKGLVIPTEVKDMAGFVFSFCEDLPVTQTALTKDEAGPCVRIYTLPNGVEVEFLFYSAYTGESEYFAGQGPYIRSGKTAEFMLAMSDTIWASENGSDLQLSGVDDPWSGFKFQLGTLAEPGHYISTGSDEAWKSVESLVDRCRKFMDKGMSRRILFHGPPGTGKTTLARHAARQVGAGKALRIEPEALSHLSTNVAYQFINLLRPSVILLDDIDRNSRDAESLLHYLERSAARDKAWSDSTLVMGTVNSVENIDPALLRPGRFDEVLLVKEPDPEYRAAIIEFYLKEFGMSHLDHKELAEKMEGFAPADIREVLACISAVGEDVLDTEVTRVRLQREHYSGDQVQKYLRSRHMVMYEEDDDDFDY